MANGVNVVLLGSPSVGRIHQEVALGREAVSRGYTVQSTTAMELLDSLVKGRQQASLEIRLAQQSKPTLLIIDELDHLPLEPQAGHLFFQLISRRYEQASVQISSNHPVEEWDEVFGDQVGQPRSSIGCCTRDMWWRFAATAIGSEIGPLRPTKEV